MYAIDIIVNSKKYETKQQIFQDFEQIAWDLEADLQKIFLKTGHFINEHWIDFFCDSIVTNKKKLQKMENKNTKKFWSNDTSIEDSLRIVQSMLRSEIKNGMDTQRGGKPLVSEIQLYHASQLEDIKSGNDSALDDAEIEMDLAKLDKKILKDGLKKMAQNMIFETDAEDLLEQVKYLCEKYGFVYKEIVPDSKTEFNKMIKVGEVKIDECNQMYFVF